MNNIEKEEVKQILKDILDDNQLVEEDNIKKVVKEVIDDSEWYSNKELFERLEKLSKDLNQTQIYVKKYNNIMDKLIKTQELADRNNTKINKLKSARKSEKQTKKGSRDNIKLIISTIMMFVGVISLMVTIAVNFL